MTWRNVVRRVWFVLPNHLVTGMDFEQFHDVYCLNLGLHGPDTSSILDKYGCNCCWWYSSCRCCSRCPCPNQALPMSATGPQGSARPLLRIAKTLSAGCRLEPCTDLIDNMTEKWAIAALLSCWLHKLWRCPRELKATLGRHQGENVDHSQNWTGNWSHFGMVCVIGSRSQISFWKLASLAEISPRNFRPCTMSKQVASHRHQRLNPVKRTLLEERELLCQLSIHVPSHEISRSYSGSQLLQLQKYFPDWKYKSITAVTV